MKNPASGFFQNCNSSPFQTTAGPGNPDPEKYPATMGIETSMTNRSLRAMELFTADDKITWDEFLEYKYDMKYSTASSMGRSMKALMEYAAAHPDAVDKQAIDLLRAWDLGTQPENPAAALGVLTVGRLIKNFNDGVPSGEELAKSLGQTVENLKTRFGRMDVPWSEVNRVVRGSADVGIGGAPDVLHAVYGAPDEATGRLIGRAGDTLVLMVRWDKAGAVHTQAVHQFGAATSIESSPHYNDQSPLFARRELRPVWREEAEIRAHLEQEYRPGEE